MPKILIDADGCPVVDVTIKVAKEFGLNVILLCDTSHQIERVGVETVIVSKGADAVDFVLINRVEKGDIVVTQDYGLAAMVLAKKGIALHQNGWQYTAENMNELLELRHFSKKVRRAGGRLKGPKKRQKDQDVLFQTSLMAICSKITQ